INDHSWGLAFSEAQDVLRQHYSVGQSVSLKSTFYTTRYTGGVFSYNAGILKKSENFEYLFPKRIFEPERNRLFATWFAAVVLTQVVTGFLFEPATQFDEFSKPWQLSVESKKYTPH